MSEQIIRYLNQNLWKELLARLKARRITVKRYNATLRRETTARDMHRPALGWELAMTLDLADCCMLDLYKAVGVDEALLFSEEAKTFIERLILVGQKRDEGIIDTVLDMCRLLCPWGYVKEIQYPTQRNRIYSIYHPPKDAERIAYYRKFKLTEVPEEEAVDFCIYNSAKTVMSLNSLNQTTIIPELTARLGYSPRWLLCMDDHGSFWGYDPLVEYCYDLYSLMQPELKNYVNAFIDGCLNDGREEAL